MVDERTVVKVYGADDCRLAVRRIGLCVDKALLVLENLYARRHKARIVTSRHQKDELFIGDVRRDNANVHAAERGIFDCRGQFIVDNEIGRRDIDILFRAVKEIHDRRLGNLPVVNGLGTVAERDAVALGFLVETHIIVGKIVRRLFDVLIVVNEEQPCKFIDCFALQTNTNVLPMSVLYDAVDILVGKIDAARVAHFPVDYGDFSMASVVEFVVRLPVEFGKRHAFYPHLCKLFIVIAGEGHHAPDIVVDDANFHARLCLFFQDIKNGIPEQPALDDEVFHKDKLFGFLQILNKRGEQLVAEGEILNFCSEVEAGRGKFCERNRLRIYEFVLLFQGEKFCRIVFSRSFRFCSFYAFLLFAVELSIIKHEVEHKPDDGNEQYEEQPRELIIGVIVSCDDADCNAHLRCNHGKIEVGNIDCDKAEYRDYGGDFKEDEENIQDITKRDVRYDPILFNSVFNYFNRLFQSLFPCARIAELFLHNLDGVLFV